MFEPDYKREDNKVSLHFVEKRSGLLPFAKKITEHDLREWSAQSGASGSLAHAEISRLMDEFPMQVVETEKSLIIYDKALVQLSNNTLKALSLPTSPEFTFHLEQKGSLATGDLKVFSRWKHGGQKIRVDRNGAFLSHKGKDHIIADPIYSILEIIDVYKAGSNKDTAKQMEMVARILDLIQPKEKGTDLRIPG